MKLVFKEIGFGDVNWIELAHHFEFSGSLIRKWSPPLSNYGICRTL